MIVPYITEKLLEINEFCEPNFTNGIVVVDEIYKNYSSIYSMLQNMPVSRWKSSPNSKNFVDYFDCRATLASPFTITENLSIIKLIKDLIKKYFNKDSVELENDVLDFGFYKNIKKDIPKALQHFPHKEESFNCLIYIDQICSGGTALYNFAETIINQEHSNLLYNISNLQVDLIRSKPNRLVIFPGWTYHGAFIENHNAYVDNWRINQLMFFKIRG